MASRIGAKERAKVVTLRRAAVAGSFYPDDPKKLRAELDRCLSVGALKPAPTKKKVIGVVSPHAGYVYSGDVVGELLNQIEIPRKIIILSPNHTGYGLPFSIMPQGEWETPLGKAKIDEDLSKLFMKNCTMLKEDIQAHLLEHSLEVQIPFLQVLKKDFLFVPITLMHISFEQCEVVGKGLAKTIQEAKEEILIMASSDMNHFENREITKKKNKLAIDQIIKLNPKELYKTVKEKSISMCGIIPTTIMMIASKELGAKKGSLVKQTTSGDVTGDYASLVGYAGLTVD